MAVVAEEGTTGSPTVTGDNVINFTNFTPPSLLLRHVLFRICKLSIRLSLDVFCTRSGLDFVLPSTLWCFCSTSPLTQGAPSFHRSCATLFPPARILQVVICRTQVNVLFLSPTKAQDEANWFPFFSAKGSVKDQISRPRHGSADPDLSGESRTSPSLSP